jgi:hypothetical protein
MTDVKIPEEILCIVKQDGDLSGLMLIWDGKEFSIEYDWK